MTYEANTGLGGVHNQYGTRNTGVSVGVEYGDNYEHTLSVEMTSSELGNGFMPPVVIPKGARVLGAWLTVSTPITIAASTTFHIGGTAPATNGVAITTANLATAGTIDLSAALAGTWATASALGITADEKVTTDAPKGTVAGEQGVANLSVKFIYKNRLHSYKAGTV